ncbi:peroxiredoxin-5, mitochondrial-like [Biomphalaria glabrata]|uniref:Peroxiredoxin-5 n=1 Tax=Biomphalaria glabrata TaxID=6526 RepID=A0A9W2ZX86_BIOGL|nr:peroxiredoxin-5, mitochondrial-like [Biomphalaria glabrata]
MTFVKSNMLLDLLFSKRLAFPNWKGYNGKWRMYSAKFKRHKVQVGDPLPNVYLYEGNPGNAISAVDLYKGKKGVLFGVVGAFTPGCTNSHIPDYLSLHEKFKEEGYMISCVSVNDPFVMDAWGKSTHADGKIRMLADPRGEFTIALGMDLDCKQIMGGIRSQKYSLVIEDGKIQSINVDPEHTGLACLLCIKNMRASDSPVPKR